MPILNILMFIVPPIFAWVIHNYLRHGDMSGKRKLFFFIFYLIVMNLIVFSFSYIRGVKGIRFEDMTESYKYKYLGLGCILGFIVPFVVCLLFEDEITFSKIGKYAKKFIDDFKKYFPYAIRAAKSDLNAEVKGSFLDWLWWMIEPFCTMIIYAVIFGVVFKASEDFFPAFIFIGITMWSFFSRSVSGAVNTIRANKHIITKVYMPKYILLLSKMFVNGFKMLVAFGVTIILMICLRVPFKISILGFIPVILVLFMFTFGVGCIMMHYGVYVSDLSYITGIVLNMLMYLTGTFYNVEKRVPAPFGPLLNKCNPIAYLIKSMRDCMLYATAPDWAMLGVWFFISCVLIVLGAYTIYHNENAYVKVI